MGSHCPISRIAIIGAGPSGTACAKFLLAEKAFEKIDIFEQRDRVGGIWNLSPTDHTRRIPIPQENPACGSYQSSNSTDTVDSNKESLDSLDRGSLELESPLYDYLETNIPKQSMAYSDFPFPEDCPLYPSHDEVLQYLDRYADQVRPLIKFQTKVQNVSLIPKTHEFERDAWELVSRDLRTDIVSKAVYDAIVVASGHYTVPHVVDVKGLSEWNLAYPGTVLHSKAYRRPEAFEGQRVLVIGNSASGVDLVGQIRPFSSQIYLSSKSVSGFELGSQPKQQDIDEVVEFLPAEQYNRAVKTKSGKIIEHLDTVLFATGYLYSFPFLADLNPPLITDGLRTRDVYQHFLHIEHPTLAFPVLNLKIVPFGLAENQAAVVARLWSGRLATPSKEEMRQWEKETISEKGDGKHFHLKRFPEEAAQMNDLYRWAAAADSLPGLENDGRGRMGIFWDHRWVWARTQFLDMRKAFLSKGDARRQVRTLEELGFDYERWQRNTPQKQSEEMFEKAKCFPPVT